MKRYLLLALAVFGLVALVPTESRAQVIISVQPGYSNGYYYQGHGSYYRHYGYHRYYHHYYRGRHGQYID